MGEYAQMSIERDLDNFFYDLDNYYNDDHDVDNPYKDYNYSRKYRETSTLYGKKKMPLVVFNVQESILLRKENSSINRECVIIKITEKAILFKIDCKVEDDLKHDYIFWVPKSAIFMLEGEKRIYYLKNWVTIKDISNT